MWKRKEREFGVISKNMEKGDENRREEGVVEGGEMWRRKEENGR